MVLYLLECRSILYSPGKPTSLLPPPNNPRMLVYMNKPDTQKTIFGRTVSGPIGFAPMGINKTYNPLSKLLVAKVAEELNLPYYLSTAGSNPIEDVGKANSNGLRFFFQLYMPHDDELNISLF